MMTIKKILYAWLLILVTITLASCSQQKEVKVGFLLSDYNIPRWEREATYFKGKMEALGAKVWVSVADGNPQKQAAQAEALFEEGIDVLVLNGANANTAAAIVREAKELGVKVIAYDGLIYNTDLDYLVGFDLEEVGRLQAAYVINHLSTANVAILNGDKAHAASAEMHKGIMKVFKEPVEQGKVNIVYDGWMENWSAKNARFFTNKIVEFSDKTIDAVVVASDAMAGGVASALQGREFEHEVIVTGQDGELDALKRIVNGTQTMTVFKSSKLIAESTAVLAFDIAQNKTIDGLVIRNNNRVDVPSLLLAPQVVDKENIEALIVKEGVFTRDQLGL